MPLMNPQPLLHIRAMIEDDLNAVMAIEVTSYPVPWKHEHFMDEIAARYSWPFVAVEEGNVVGYACLMSLFEEAQILNIAVQSSQRGRGIARMLLEHAFSLALEQGAEVMSLEVRASNIAAISLYEKLDFTRVGIRTGYYESAEDAILMEKPLKESP
jgi:[ribosomal protein S18]-alanine N-acetyltransferase